MTNPEIPGPNAPTEPAAWVGTVSTAAAAVLVLLVAFGVPISAEQKLAIIGVIAGVGPLATALIVRGRVYSPATVRAMLRR